MRTFKIIGLILLAMVAAIFLWAAILPSSFTVDKHVYIQSNRATIHEVIADFNQWTNWSPWHDSTTQISYGGEPFGKGAKMSWKNDQMAVGEMTIVDCHPDSFVLVMLKALETNDSSFIEFRFKDFIDSTRVTIHYESEGHDYFLGRFEGFILRTAMEESSEIGLQRMKKYAEEKPEEPELFGFEVEEMDLPQRYFIGVRDSFETANMEAYLTELRTMVDQKVQSSGVEVLGAPLMVWEKHDAKAKSTVRYGYPVAEGAAIPENLIDFHLPAYRIARVRVEGDFNAQNGAWIAIQKYLRHNKLNGAHFAYEEFEVGSHNEQDTSLWVTYNVYPIINPESNE